MEILNTTYATANLIRLAKVEQIYSQLQAKVKNIPSQRMTTLESSLVIMEFNGGVTAEQAEMYADNPAEFRSALGHLQDSD